MLCGIEADDVIATMAQKASALGWSTVVSTGDKDLAQLVDAQVRLVNTMTRDAAPAELIDEAGVMARFGVRPDQIVDYLTLVGDAVDNVPGVDKVGPKTAAKWLAQYGSLDALLVAAPGIAGAVGENLRRAVGWLPTARELVTVRRNCELPADCEPGEATRFKEADREGLRSLYTDCGFRTWLRELDAGTVQGSARGSTRLPALGPDQHPTLRPAEHPTLRSEDQPTLGRDQHPTLRPEDQPTLRPEQHSANIPGPPVGFRRETYETVLSDDALARWAEKLWASEVAAVDTETTDLDPMRAQLVGIALAVADNDACYIPVAHVGLDQPTQLPRDRVLEVLTPWLISERHGKLGQNIKYDLHVFENNGVRLGGVREDSLLASYVLEAHRNHDMDALAERHLQHRTISYDEVTGKGAARIGFADVPLAIAAPYAAEDADVTFRLCRLFSTRFAAETRLASIYRSMELPVMQVLQRVERHGVLIDPDSLQTQSVALQQKIGALETQAHAAAGRAFNLGSTRQLAELLFGELKLPVLKKTASGAASTDEEVLAKLAEDYPLPRLVLQWRGLSKLKSTYTDKLPRMIHPVTGRVHTSYSQAVAVTGRLASNDPNLQNIPIRTAEGRRIREAFIAPAGYRILSADYSQIELRIMAHISGDSGLLGAFARGEDVHRATAAEVFGISVEEVSAEQRRYAKVINFGLIYGMSAFGLASNLNIERQQARSYMDRYFARYPGVLEYMERTRQSARQQGYVETVFGRRLWLAEINSPNGPRRQAAERAAINAPMQGTAADLIKMAMIVVDRRLREAAMASRLIMQVHDELVFEAAEPEVETLRDLVRESMQQVAELAVPLEVGIGIGGNWDEAH
jgi:DNA polymerase-1